MSRSVRISDEIVEDGAGDSPFVATAPPKDGDVVEDDQVSEESHPLLHAAASYHRKGDREPTFCCWMTKPKVLILFGILFVFFTALAVVMPWLIDMKLKDGLKMQKCFAPDCDGYEAWVNNTEGTSVPISFKVYMYNVTNPTEVENGSAPNVEQIGPYVYDEYRVKLIQNYTDDDNVVEFYTWKYFVFNRNKTNASLSEDDIFTSPYMVVQGVKASLTPWDATNKIVMDTLYELTNKRITLFYQRSMHDIIWGYPEDPVLKAVSTLKPGSAPTGWQGVQPNLTSIANTKETTSVDAVYTGRHNMSQTDVFLRWQNMSSLYVCTKSVDCAPFQYEWTDEEIASNSYIPLWGDKYANMINGTDATMWNAAPMPPAPEKSPYQYVDTVRRSSQLVTDGEEVELRGVKLRRYRIDPLTFLNASSYAPQAGFYQFGLQGLENFTVAQLGVPVFLSKPQFFDCDPKLREMVTGIPQWDPEDVDVLVDIEPISGITMRAAQRVQLNVYIESWPGLTKPWFGNTPPAYVPIAWFDESFELPESLTSQFKSQVYFANDMKTTFKYGGLAAGFVCILMVAVVMLLERKRHVRWQQIHTHHDRIFDNRITSDDLDNINTV